MVLARVLSDYEMRDAACMEQAARITSSSSAHSPMQSAAHSFILHLETRTQDSGSDSSKPAQQRHNLIIARAYEECAISGAAIA